MLKRTAVKHIQPSSGGLTISPWWLASVVCDMSDSWVDVVNGVVSAGDAAAAAATDIVTSAVTVPRCLPGRHATPHHTERYYSNCLICCQLCRPVITSHVTFTSRDMPDVSYVQTGRDALMWPFECRMTAASPAAAPPILSARCHR